MSPSNVHNAQIRAALPELLRSVMEIVSVFNAPERDAAILAKAGLSLERALFPLLVLVDKFGPIGVVELAERVGRDHTTVSRQIGRLEELGLVARRPNDKDKRVREAIVTSHGETFTKAIDATRQDMAEQLFNDWSQQDFDALVRLAGRLAEGMRAFKT